tara:strand:- start:478 stop:834 length:357 start_codon:yes stop_codon:yes gene_type:complete
MIFLKQIFTWWHGQTLGTFLNTVFFGQYVGKDDFGNKYYKNKNDKRWVVYKKGVEATKIPPEWYLWIHHTTNEPFSNIKKKYKWQKEHSENLTGTSKAYKPNKITKKINFKKYDTWKN